MNSDQTCLTFLDELSGSLPPSAALLEHVRSCPSCRDSLQAMQAIRPEASAFDPAEIARFKAGVCDRLFAPEPATPPRPSATGSSQNLSSMSLASVTLVAGCVALLLYAGSRYFSPPESGASLAPAPVIVTTADGAAQTLSLGVPFRLESGTAKIGVPDGSFLTLTGPGEIMLRSQDLYLTSGRVQIDKVGSMRLSTPHGSLVAAGSAFECLAQNDKTTVSVTQGSVRLMPQSASSSTLQAGQAGILKATPDATSARPTVPGAPIVDLNGE